MMKTQGVPQVMKSRKGMEVAIPTMKVLPHFVGAAKAFSEKISKTANQFRRGELTKMVRKAKTRAKLCLALHSEDFPLIREALKKKAIKFSELQEYVEKRSGELKEMYNFDMKFASLAVGNEFKAVKLQKELDALSAQLKKPFFETAQKVAEKYANMAENTVRGRIAAMRDDAAINPMRGASPGMSL